ncbi:MAG: ABC transporter permease subunit [Chloroflexi bacterium]|nr:ABC transporter permease subunit [Chloroflexota bacterium]
MRNLLNIAAKEMRSYFVSPVAYLIVAFWLIASGFFFWLSVSITAQASMTDVFGVIPVFLLLISPALTMRLLAEESRTGTLELLLTAPVRDWAVVLGKFLGALGLYATMIALTLVYPLIFVVFGGNPDWGPIWSGYLGLVLLGMTFLAIGIFASALTSNQMVSAVIAFVILLLFYIIGQIGGNVNAGAGAFLSQLSLLTRFDSFTRGVIDLKDVIFYLTFTTVVLFITVQIVETRRYRA